MLQYIIIAYLVLIAASGGYFYYSQNKIESLVERSSNLEIALATETASLEICEITRARSIASMNKLMGTNQRISQDVTRYLEVFKRHDLGKLAEAKPGLVESRINKGTAKLLKELEDETANTD